MAEVRGVICVGTLRVGVDVVANSKIVASCFIIF